MTFAMFQVFFGVFSLGFSVTLRADETHIQLKGLEWIEESAEGVSLSYRLPCGSQFLGYVLSGTEYRTQVGVAIRAGRVQCLGLQEIQTDHLSWLKLKKGGTIQSIETPNPRSRWRLQALHGLGTTKKTTKSNGLWATFSGGCRSESFTLLRSLNGDHLELGAIVSDKEAARGLDQSEICQRGDTTTTIPGVQLASSVSVTSLPPVREDLSKAYRLKLVPILNNSLRRKHNGGGIEFSYQRRCHQSPIGAVVRRVNSGTATDTVHIRLGMLVAEFYNMECLSGEPLVAASRYEDPSLNLPLNAKLGRLPVTDSKLSIRQPNISDLIQGQRKLGLIFDFRLNCSHPMGVVYGKDRFGNLAVGVLDRSQKDGCQLSHKKVSWYHPYLSHDGAQRATYPLTLAKH